MIRSSGVRVFTQPRARRDRKLLSIVQPWVNEIAPAMHLEVGHERIPVRHTTPGARPRMLIDPRQAECRRDQRGGGLAIGTERLTVECELGVELARPPAGEHLANGRLVDPQKVYVGLQCRGQGHNGPDVQIAVGPAIEPTADAGRQGVVDMGMAERALDAEGREASLRIEEPGHAHHRIGLDEGERTAGVVQVNFPCLEGLHEGRRERRDIDLEAGGQGLLRRDAGTDAAMLLSRDPLMELERAAPEPLTAEGVVAKRRPAFVHQPPGILANGAVEASRRVTVRLGSAHRHARRPH